MSALTTVIVCVFGVIVGVFGGILPQQVLSLEKKSLKTISRAGSLIMY